MLKGLIKPIGAVLGGILCIHLNAFAAETDTKKSAPPAKKEATKAPQKKAAATPKQKETAAPSGKKENDANKILATVNGENITQTEVDKILNKYAGQIGQDQIPLLTKRVVDSLITQKLIVQFIRDKKIEAGQSEIDAELNKIREDAQSNPELKGQTLEQILESHGGNIDDLKRDITISLSLEKYFSKDIDDQKVKAYYEKNKSSYDGSEVKASHILVDTRQMKTEEELAQAKEKINKAKAEVAAGKDFAEVAKQYSDCPSKENGGDLGFFGRRGRMVEPFAAAAFSMKEGEVSDPVTTEFGYHIIKVTEIKKGQDINFDDIKRDVKVDMMSEKLNVLLKDLRQKAKIDVKV